MYHAVKSLTNVSHSSLLVSHSAAQCNEGIGRNYCVLIQAPAYIAQVFSLFVGATTNKLLTPQPKRLEPLRRPLRLGRCRLRSTAPSCQQLPFKHSPLRVPLPRSGDRGPPYCGRPPFLVPVPAQLNHVLRGHQAANDGVTGQMHVVLLEDPELRLPL